MSYLHRQRLIGVIIIVAAVAIAAALALYALQQNINLFYSPTDIASGKVPLQRAFRLGGMVQRGSVNYMPRSLTVHFAVTDGRQRVNVTYTGVLPDLFREGQGVVLEGKLVAPNQMLALQVLAKHDEKYMPAAVKAMMKKGST